ncbi:polar amino acid transport system ATP-binding protein [Sporomusaceae bacterium BoRhaA]|uniref:amino acid ABC transporter ATP-binding protein n=1 Tax=Pelorhabdus rhamnosifermentans TaxID=2772457 RepID=UPI001C061B58|nr:amino acid ABC transporter ATP-binding protein [Pelorhabdus rhamnosifermentans]MBU2698978.1 polar amino acid transport system ATP-binding protein [Pelorhabdus rhamnosifermentans]
MLSLQHLRKNFGSLKAIDDLSLTVSKGQTVVIMGPSGCGKSTTIRTINRLVEPDQGSILFNGKEMLTLEAAELRKMRKKIGFVFQHFNLISRLSTLENVMLGLVMDGLDKEEARDKALQALEKVGLTNHQHHKPSELSGGQQQRVGIARALAFEPELMLWDEPTASLDPILVREVLVVMEDLAKYQDSTMLVVTHEISFALHVAQQIVLMDQGRIVEQGQPSQVFLAPASAIGQQYKQLIEYQLNQTEITLYGKQRAAV